jgi:hypothetical protein
MSDNLTNVRVSIEISCLTDDVDGLRESVDENAFILYDILFDTPHCIDPVMSVQPPTPFEFEDDEAV